ARRALDALTTSLRVMYRDPEHALRSFLGVAGREPAVAVRDLRDTPERFGELLTPEGRPAGRAAAAAGREVIDAERAFRVAIANARNGRRRQAGSPGVDGSDQEPADAQGAVRADLERIQVSLRKLRDEEQRMPGRHLLEHALARGLWELSPPEFNRLRLVTGSQFSLARKLRQMAQDVALG